MALQFLDSFDHYVTADVPQKYNTNDNATISAGQGRFGSAALRLANWGHGATKTLNAQATWVFGFGFRTSGLPNIDGAVVALLDAGTLQCELKVTTDGKLRITRNGTSLGLGATLLQLNRYYFIEFKVTINNSTGVAVAKIDGVTELNLTSQDTQNTANATADGFRLLDEPGINTPTEQLFDDLYVCDGTGSAPTNDFLGDVRVEYLAPNGNGNSSVLVGSDGNSTDNYLLVDEAAQDGDTTYVESSTVGDKDTYTYANLTPTAGTVYGVQVLPFAKKTDAGTRSIVSVARLSATEVDSASKTLSSTYAYLPDIREAKPGGGVWSISDVNSAEFGVKVTA